jgi:hypothetical protein
MSNEIIKILFSKDSRVTPTMLETASELGVLELYRLLAKDGVYLKPGVLAKNLTDNTLMPSTTSTGINISVGSAVVSDGQVISVVGALSKELTLANYKNKTLFIKYDTELSDDIQTRNPSSGLTFDVSYIKSQDVDKVLFWVSSYNPSSDADLTAYSDAVPLGKLIQIAGAYVFLVSDGHRRLALPNIRFVGTGHWDGEFVPSVDQWTSIYSLLAAEGHGTRTTNNVFGLSTSDIQFLLETFKALIYQPGIPVTDFTTDTNKNYLLVQDKGDGSDRVKIDPGVAIDLEGRRLYLANEQAVEITDNNTWYYLAIKYKESGDQVYNKKDYYEFTLTIGSYTNRVNLARVKNNAGVISIIDERQVLVCYGYVPEPQVPGLPTGLVLTTGFEDEFIHSDVDTQYGTGAADSIVERRSGVSKAWIKATWNPSSGGGDPIAYELSLVPLDNTDQERTGQRSSARAIKGPGNLTPDTDYTFRDLTAGEKFKIRVRAIGASPHHLESVWSGVASIIAGVGVSLTMGPITLEELSYGDAGDTGTSRYQLYGIKASWAEVLYAKAYEIYAKKDSAPNLSLKADRYNNLKWRGAAFEWTLSGIKDGDHWYFAVRCFDDGGFPSNIKTGDITVGDIIAPTVPTIVTPITTGFERDLIKDVASTYVDNIVTPELAYIELSWSASTDTQSGLKQYEVWMAPAKKDNDALPDEDKRLEGYSRTARVGYTTPDTRYSFHNLRPGVKYFFKVRAQDKRGNWSAWSAQQSVVAGKGYYPSPPAKPVITVTAATNSVIIRWDDVANAHGYEVFVKENTCPSTSPDACKANLYEVTKKAYTVYNTPSSGITQDYSVCVRVRAFDQSGQYGEISECVCSSPSIIDAVTFINLKSEVELARGTAASLNSRLNVGIDSDGILKPISEMESEVASARGGYENLKSRIDALSSAAVAWKYVKIVAKDGTGQYTTLQSAVNAVPDQEAGEEPDKYAIWIMPGIYTEEVNFEDKGNILLYSFGAVIVGRLYNSGTGRDYIPVILMDGIRLIKPDAGTGSEAVSFSGNEDLTTPGLEIINSVIINKYTTLGALALKTIAVQRLTIKNSYLKCYVTGAQNVIEFGSSGGAKFKAYNTTFSTLAAAAGAVGVIYDPSGETFWLYNCTLNANCAMPAVHSAGVVFMRHCGYQAACAGGGTFDYGTADNQTNVIFGNNDLVAFDEWTNDI